MQERVSLKHVDMLIQNLRKPQTARIPHKRSTMTKWQYIKILMDHLRAFSASATPPGLEHANSVINHKTQPLLYRQSKTFCQFFNFAVLFSQVKCPSHSVIECKDIYRIFTRRETVIPLHFFFNKKEK